MCPPYQGHLYMYIYANLYHLLFFFQIEWLPIYKDIFLFGFATQATMAAFVRNRSQILSKTTETEGKVKNV